MTLAVCIACGEEKFGALMPCRHCGFQPSSPIDEAKSCMLTAPPLSSEDLAQFGATSRTGKLVDYDSVSLASLYVQFLDDAYFSSSLDLVNGVLPCKLCRKLFRPALEEVYCPSCAAIVEPALAPCTQCKLLYDPTARYCQKCGLVLSPNPDLTTKDVGVSMALCVRRAVTSGEPFKHSQYLRARQDALNDDQRAASDFELETVGMYSEIVTLSKYMSAEHLLVKTVHEMVELGRQAFILEGASEESADLAT